MSYPSASTGLRIGLPLPKTRFDNSSTQPPPPSRFPMGTSPTLSCPHLSAALETHLSSGCLLSHCQGPAQEPIGLRSLKGMEALKAAEFGDGMIILEPSGTQHCRLTEGTRFSLDPMTPGGSSLPHSQNSRVADTRIGQALPSQDTLINLSGLSNNGRELKTLLGNTNSKLKAGATLYTAPVRCNTLCDRKTQIPDKPVTLEQAKTKARVEVDIVLESSVIVQGGILGGHIEVHVRRRSKKEAPVLLADGKVRLIGFELIPQSDESHTFFHFAASLPLEPRGSQKLYASPPDDEGYSQASEGTHLVPFAIELPKSGASGNAKGPLMMSPGVVVRYIAMMYVQSQSTVTTTPKLITISFSTDRSR